MSRCKTALLTLLVAGLPFAAAGVEPGPLAELRFDPFARPDLSGADLQAPGLPGELFVPVLRGTLIAGENSLANLGGFVLQVGQEAHGWRLLEVGPFQATFEHNGQRVVLDVDGATRR